MRDVVEAVLDWADERGILDQKTPDRQALKMVTEVGEFVDELLKGDKDKASMELGDVLVTLIITSWLMGIDIELALRDAYDKISKRTGKLVDGVFVKD